MSWHRSLSKKYEVKKKNKYDAGIKTELDGYSFASKSEAALYVELKKEMHAGLWVEVHCQPSVYMTDARILYKPDFMTVDPNGRIVYHESKGGFETAVWRIKRRLWPFYVGNDLVVYGYDYRKGVVTFKEKITPRVKK